MKFNAEKTENLAGVSHLATIQYHIFAAGVVGRWYCPVSKLSKLLARVEGFDRKYSAWNGKIQVSLPGEHNA
jgi:hypothetical protein